jgi:hypothetical protein
VGPYFIPPRQVASRSRMLIESGVAVGRLSPRIRW